MNSKPKAVIYSRTSQDSIADSGKENKFSIELQIEECKKLSEKEGYEIIGIYQDRNLSSVTYPTGFEKTADDDEVFKAYMQKTSKTPKEYFRPGLGEMMKRLKEIDYVLVRDETRLMRPLIYSNLLGTIYGKFLTKDIKIHCANGSRIIDPKNFEHAFMSTVISMTEVNSMLHKIEASKSSLKKKRDQGSLYHSMYMFGYESLDVQKVGIVYNEAKVIKEIYRLFLKENKPIGQIVKTLNEMQVRSKRKKLWTHQGVLKILKRVEYAGYQRDTDEILIPCIPLKGNEIVSLAEWESVQDILKTNKKFKRSESKEIRPLTGLCYCAYCGTRLYVAKSQQFNDKKYNSYYVCLRGSIDRHPSKENLGCRLVRVREKRPDEVQDSSQIVYERNGLREVVMPLLFKFLMEAKAREIVNNPLKSDMARINQNLKTINEKQVNIASKYAKGEMSEEENDMYIGQFHRQRADLNNQLKAIQKEMKDDDIDLLDREDLIDIAFKMMSNKIAPELYRVIARHVIEKIYVAAFKVRIIFKDGTFFDLERVPVTSSRSLPNVSTIIDWRKDYLNSQYVVAYLYKSYFKWGKNSVTDRTEKVIYESTSVKVLTRGKNPQPREYLLKRKQRKRLDKMGEYSDEVFNPRFMPLDKDENKENLT